MLPVKFSPICTLTAASDKLGTARVTSSQRGERTREVAEIIAIGCDLKAMVSNSCIREVHCDEASFRFARATLICDCWPASGSNRIHWPKESGHSVQGAA